jgi:hypothetical protein
MEKEASVNAVSLYRVISFSVLRHSEIQFSPASRTGLKGQLQRHADHSEAGAAFQATRQKG